MQRIMRKNSCSVRDKIKHKLHGDVLRCVSAKWSGYLYLYSSYRHCKKKGNSENTNIDDSHLYFTEEPNSGAGIGHQLANWISGYWFAKVFGLQYAYSKFSSNEWDSFLGFGESEKSVEELIQQGYKKVLLPPFSENITSEIDMIRKIIISYSGKKVIFFAEQDTGYRDQFGVMNDIKNKFNNAKARKADRIIYSKEEFNIAVHIRRGDIVAGQNTNNPELQKRWMDNCYYVNVLRQVLDKYLSDKKYHIFIFSQGEVGDFEEFTQFEHVDLCLDMSPKNSFLHMVRADLLITSKSSFSYKPALISEGIRICPKNFWHGYPQNEKWILADDDGTILAFSDL